MALAAKRTTGSSRLSVLEESREWLGSFLKRVRGYDGLLDNETQRLLRPLADGGSAAREAKVARHRALTALRRTIASAPLGAAQEEEEWTRNVAMAQLGAQSLEAQGELESILVEMSLLRLRDAAEPLDMRTASPGSSPPSAPPPPIKPLKPFVLLNTRQQLRDQVFRPGHRLPTMTIDEYLELERQRGGILEHRTTGRAEEDEDRDEVADRKTAKDRHFDLFKDDNPRGWGNTRNLG